MLACFKRFHRNFTSEEKYAYTTGAYDVDTTWYADSGAIDHITRDLEKLTTREKYLGNDQVHIASGSGMKINQAGHYVIHTPSRDLSLHNVLYVPKANKNLVSFHRFTLDNHVFMEHHPWHFLIKGWASRRVLHDDMVERGLYPLKSLGKEVLAVTKPSHARWHSRLGHPALQIVQCMLGQNKLPVSNESWSKVCDACQMGRAHQLSYPKSLSVSTAPLELGFFQCLGLAPESVGRKHYYVSFIDDFSKYVWIYIIKHIFEVFECFQNFPNLVERLFS
jgi:hypothetical protein